MKNSQFIECMEELAGCFNYRLNEKQMAIWFKNLNARGYIFVDLAKAVEKLSISEPRFPALAAVIKACQEQQTRRLESDADRKKKEEEKPFQARMYDGTPIVKYIPLVLAALSGDDQAKNKLDWQRKG